LFRREFRKEIVSVVTLLWKKDVIKRGTYRMPAPIGAIALKNDMAVVDIPLAVPLCS
jgi:hypothetical protein